MSSSANAPEPNTVIAGRYRLDRAWAHGGMADVWKAHDLQLDRVVAVKLLKPHLAADDTVAERFRREAIAAASLSHPNIVTVYDAVSDNGRQAVIMEFVDGRSLRNLLDDSKRLSPKLTVHIGTSICSALDAAHRNNIIHRDVKPGNVLVTKTGRVMLTDFGIAKALGSGEDLTSENIMMGTAKYLSPEQVKGDELDLRADLYSLGLVLYECLAGRVPFVGKNDTETALARLQRDATDIATIRSDVNTELAAVIHRMLERRPERRYASGAEAKTALRSAVPNADASPTPRSASHPSTGDRTPTPGKIIRPPSHTPSGNSPRPRPTPASGTKRPFRGSPVLWGGFAVAMVALATLVVRIASGDDSPTAPPIDTTVAPVSSGPPVIAGVTAFDPEGDRTENDASVNLTTDADKGTVWSTVCYKSSTFGSKSGVGLVVKLAEPSLAKIDVDLSGDEWKAELYTSNTLSESLSDWGSSIGSAESSGGSTLTGVMSSPAQYALVYLREVGRDGGCSKDNPYRGNIAEIRVSPAP
ncbi:MAG: hypothetical protein RL391_312 [Actinomycetota bacterium]|jgi:serine/threonine-protein kinase